MNFDRSPRTLFNSIAALRPGCPSALIGDSAAIKNIKSLIWQDFGSFRRSILAELTALSR